MFRRASLFAVLLQLGTNLLQDAIAQQNRTRISVEFEYRLEINITSSEVQIDTVEEELNATLTRIQSSLIQSFEERIADGSSDEVSRLSGIEYNRVESHFERQCFTKNDGCQWVTSIVYLSFEGQKPKNSIERVTLQLAQEFLRDYTKQTPMVQATYTYPMLASGSGRFTLGMLNGTMGSMEIDLFRVSFINVFAAVVYAFDGDTEVTDSQVIYQDVKREGLNENSSLYVTVDVQYFGRCRYCSNTEFILLVNGVIYDSMILEAFRKRLKYEGAIHNTSYFDNLQTLKYSEREMPPETPSVLDESVYDLRVPQTTYYLPPFLWVGVILAAVVIGIGTYLIKRDRDDFLKDEKSTDGDDSPEEGISGSECSSDVEDGDDEYSKGSDDDCTNEDYRQNFQEDLGESTIVSYNNTPSKANGNHKQEYEIYVQ